MGMKASEEALGDNGLTDIEEVKSFLFDPANRNYQGKTVPEDASSSKYSASEP